MSSRLMSSDLRRGSPTAGGFDRGRRDTAQEPIESLLSTLDPTQRTTLISYIGKMFSFPMNATSEAGRGLIISPSERTEVKEMLVRNLGVTPDKAERMIYLTELLFKAEFPNFIGTVTDALDKLVNSAKQFMARDGYVELLSERRLQFSDFMDGINFKEGKERELRAEIAKEFIEHDVFSGSMRRIIRIHANELVETLS